jgi:hypothetical protein
LATDQELITQTVQDYFGGWYDAGVARMDRAPHPDLGSSPAEADGVILTKEVMLQACAEGGGTRTADRWVKIDIAHVCGRIASAVVRSASYREYLYLIRTGGGRKILDALWLPR